MKTYKLLIDSPEYPKGTEAKYDDFFKSYTIWMYGNIQVYTVPESFTENVPLVLKREQVENRPEVWELIEDKLDLRSPEAEKMREESRATRFEFVPKNGEAAYYYDHGRRLVLAINYSGGFLMDWHNGFIKRTERECKAHAEKYARYFLTE